jgi:hypothetical protein
MQARCVHGSRAHVAWSPLLPHSSVQLLPIPRARALRWWWLWLRPLLGSSPLMLSQACILHYTCVCVCVCVLAAGRSCTDRSQLADLHRDSNQQPCGRLRARHRAHSGTSGSRQLLFRDQHQCSRACVCTMISKFVHWASACVFRISRALLQVCSFSGRITPSTLQTTLVDTSRNDHDRTEILCPYQHARFSLVCWHRPRRSAAPSCLRASMGPISSVSEPTSCH